MNNNPTLKPYLVNAFYTWTMDTGTTPLIEVVSDFYNTLPDNIKQENTIILNIHPDATRNMILGKNDIQFEAMFSGEDFKVNITYESIQKIFTKEDGYGLEFSVDSEKIKTPYLSKNTQRKIIHKKHLKLIKNES
jgi:stringent starvation protein B